NGKVLLSDNPHHQLPKEAMDFYLKLARQAGNLVIGAKTYRSFLKFPDEVKALFKGIEIIVLSDGLVAADSHEVVRKPEEAIDLLSKKGYQLIAIGGGTGTFNAFLDGDLVSDIYFNISPMITGKGGILASRDDLNTKFKLVGCEVNGDYAQLHLAK